MKFLVTIMLALFTFANAHSQIVDRTKERTKESATDKTNSRIDQRVDQGIDKGLDAIEGLFKKKDKNKSKNSNEEVKEESNTSSTDQGGRFGNKGSKEDVRDSYVFDNSIDFTITTYNKKGKADDPVTFTYLFSKENYMGTDMSAQGVEVKAIVDMDRMVVVSLTKMPAMSMGSVLNIDSDDVTDAQNEMTSEQGFKKTGNTKVIAGYDCDEYVSSDEESEYHMWLTDDMDFGMGQMTTAMKNNKEFSSMPEGYPEGNLLETEIISKKNSERTIMTASKIQRSINLEITTSGYTWF